MQENTNEEARLPAGAQGVRVGRRSPAAVGGDTEKTAKRRNAAGVLRFHREKRSLSPTPRTPFQQLYQQPPPGAVRVGGPTERRSSFQQDPPQKEEGDGIQPIMGEQEDTTQSMGESQSLFLYDQGSDNSNDTIPPLEEDPRIVIAPYEDDVPVVAVTVEECDLEQALKDKEAEMEEQIRNRILQEAVSADILYDDNNDAEAPTITKRQVAVVWVLACCCLQAVLSLLIAGIVIAMQSKNQQEASSSSLDEHQDSIILPDGKDQSTLELGLDEENQSRTLEQIRERGYLRCGVSASDHRYNNSLTGFEMVMCRAVAAAVFGDPTLVEDVPILAPKGLDVLAGGSIDLLAAMEPCSMGTNVWHPPSSTGFSFSTPLLYGGMVFLGDPETVGCAEDLLGPAASNNGRPSSCREDLRVCVPLGTFLHWAAVELLPKPVVVPTPNRIEMALAMTNGTCNVAAASLWNPTEFGVAMTPTMKVGTKVFAKQPLSLVTRDDHDPQWSSLVDLVVNVLYLAEANNVTKESEEGIASTDVVSNLPLMVKAAVSVVTHVGNYGDIYQQTMEEKFPRGGMNTVYKNAQNHTSGLLYAFPFGDLAPKGPGPTPNSTLQRILDRGYLRCGVVPRAGRGFADGHDGSWSGFYVDYCRAVAAAVFQGEERLQLVGVAEEPYEALASGQVDTVAGLRVVLQAGLKEPTTEKAYAFSPPVFYDNDAGDAYALATDKEEQQWSRFVYWIVSGIVRAEEKGITQNTYLEMPVTGLFGEGLEQMLRDSVGMVGSYGEVYNRTLAKSIPRTGSNLPNNGSGPQQFPIPWT